MAGINVLRRTGTGDNFGDNQYGMAIGPMAALRINFHAFVGWTTVLLGVIFLVGVIAYMLYKSKTDLSKDNSPYFISRSMFADPLVCGCQ